jgi:hypothetical protein
MARLAVAGDVRCAGRRHRADGGCRRYACSRWRQAALARGVANRAYRLDHQRGAVRGRQIPGHGAGDQTAVLWEAPSGKKLQTFHPLVQGAASTSPTRERSYG